MEDSERILNKRRSMMNLLSLLKDYKAKAMLAIAFAIISTLFNIFTPLLIGNSITLVFDGVNNIIHHTGTIDIQGLINILIILVVLYVVCTLVSYLEEYILAQISAKICFTLREMLISKMTHLPMNELDETKRGDIISRVTNDVDTLESALTEVFLELLKSIITIVGVVIVMLTINVWLTLAIIVLVPISFALIHVLSGYSQKYFRNQLDLQGSVNAQIEETITAHDMIRSFNYEDESYDVFDRDNKEWYGNEWKAQFFASLNNPLMGFISRLTEVIIAVLGSVFVLQGAMPVGMIITFFQYSGNFTEPIIEITSVMPFVQVSLAACDRIFEFLEIEDEENPSTKQFNGFSDEITFENVNFGYVEGEKIINDFSLTVKKGEKVAIVGKTGAGKTTIIKLLMRLYDLDSGEIKIDGININEYDKNSIRSFMGMVLQDSWLFSDTIENNILYGKLDATQDELVSASKQASTDNFIRQLPEGYKTKLNEDSDNLSHGQKQLLTIARTFISGKEILILDEATSSVDTRTEKLIQKAMNKLMENRTSFVIAHRLSTIRNADKIVVIENGSIIEQGTHEELLAQKGYYYNTLNAQN